MGKKSRLKKERRERENQKKRKFSEERNISEPLLVKVIQFGVILALFTPLILSSKFYFPFVGPKSLYFMGIVQIIFFIWLFLILNHKEYRPKFNSIFLALLLFLIVLVVSAIFGVDFSRSFWSKYERMTGVLMWLHLFGFFLVISSTFKRVSDWQKIFVVSISVAMLVGVGALFEKAGIKEFIFSDRGGFTLGNTSFLGTYLLFNAFLALWLFFQKRDWRWRIYSLIAVTLMVPAMYLQGARAATGSFLGGLGLIFLLWLAFQPSSKKIKIVGKVLLIASVISVLTAIILLFIPGSFVHQKFAELATQARFKNWEMAKKAFLERPILGWGPENYTIVFTKYFHPCLFLPECGGEVWFDRSHNIVFDTLSTTGILGLLTYLGIFLALFLLLIKKFFKEKLIDFWTFSIFIALPTAYFVQNLTVFDMVTSLMMFFLILGFLGFLANLGKEEKIERKFEFKHQWLAGLLIVLFLLTFYEFIIQPFRTDYLVIKALQTFPSQNLLDQISKEAPDKLKDFLKESSQKRIELYKKTLQSSPLGKYQIREFFGQQSEQFIRNHLNIVPPNQTKEELNFLVSELEKTKKESPLDFRSMLRLGYLYNLYYFFDTQKLTLAEENLKKAIELSPTNQQGYWALAQTKVYQGKFEEALSLAEKAINLEPKWFQSHKIALQIAKFAGKKEKQEEIINRAKKINPDWEKELKDLL